MAFSIVDLLAVAICFGLLFAVAHPSLQSALNLSRNNICLDRLRSIGQASLIYSNNDLNNMAIPVHAGWNDPFYWERDRPVGAYEWGGKSGVGRDDFMGAPTPIHSAFGTRAGFGPATRPLNSILYKGGFHNNAPGGVGSSDYDRIGAYLDTQLNLDAFRCPGDDGPPEAAHCPDWIDEPDRSSFDHFGTSYAANIFMIASSGGGGMYSNSPYLRPLAAIPDAVRTLMYEENIGRWAWACKNELSICSFIGDGVDPGPTKTLSGWHGKAWTYNRAFADAHAETQQIFIAGTEDAFGYANHYRNNEQLSEIYRCVIIRGDGWQKDTFPADQIPTGFFYPGGGRPSYENCVESARARTAVGAQSK